MAQALGVVGGGAVAGNFVVFDALRGGNQGGVFHFGAGVFGNSLLAFGHEALHGFAGVAVEVFAHRAANLLEAADLILSFQQVLLEARAQLRVLGFFYHGGQGLHQLVFGAVKVSELFHEQVFEGAEFVGHNKGGSW